LPHCQVRELDGCLKGKEEDRYDAFYGMLYGDSAAHLLLDRRMRSACFKIRLRRGEGYLINDRRWMHGRTMTARSVTRNRLHRLTF
jgi:alpha-ketoglutarate-dependent taurine dioxygenase